MTSGSAKFWSTTGPEATAADGAAVAVSRPAARARVAVAAAARRSLMGSPQRSVRVLHHEGFTWISVKRCS
jgi:hypothetical protein